MTPLVSVVVPTWKRPGLLEKCLNTLLSQVFPANSYEIIIVTDGPDDDSCRLVRQYQQLGHKHLYCISNSSKLGPAAARNKGWQIAKAPLVVFTDDDCLTSPDWLMAYHQAFCDSGLHLVAFTGNVTVPMPPVPTDYEQNVAHLSTAEFITANCACSRAALLAVNGFDEAFPVAWREDSELQFKFISHNIPVFKVTTAKVVHPVRPAPWGISLKEQKKSIYNALLYKKYPGLYRLKISSSPQWHYYGIIICIVFAIAAMAAGSSGWLIPAATGWAVLTGYFILKRLKGTSRSARHIAEMVYTSLFIPFLSVYWTLYGSFRYKVLFL